MLCPRVIGRDGELALLRATLRAASAGRGGVVFLAGEAGIGKSRLARELTAEAASKGWAVLGGRAVESGAPVAFRPLAEALCAYVRASGEPDAAALGPYRAALGVLVPQWETGRARSDDSVVALAEGVARLLRVAAAGRGSLLVLEDLHWADPDTLAVLEYLTDNLATEPVLCVATLRDEHPCAGLDLARAAHSRRSAQVLALERLNAAAVADMAGSCLDTPLADPEVLALAARSEGVPFLVEELLAGALATGTLVGAGSAWRLAGPISSTVPATFADTVHRRLDRLDSPARAAVRAAAVLGRQFSWDLLPAMTGLSADGVLAGLREAVGAQLVEVAGVGPGFRFRHALTRDAVLGDLLPPERAELSRLALGALDADAVGGDLPEGVTELGAALAETAGDGPRAAGLLLDLGRRALARGALATAEVTLGRAREIAAGAEPVGTEVEELLVEVLSLAGKPVPAATVGESLLRRLAVDPLTGRGADRSSARRRAEVHVRLARAAVAATDWVAAGRHVDLARSEAGSEAGEEFGARVDSIEALAALGADDPDRAARLARAALLVAERAALPEVACESLEVLGRCDRWRDLPAAETAFRRGLAVADQHGLGVWRLRALHELGTIDLLESGRTARLEEAYDLAVRFGALARAADLGIQIAAGLLSDDDPKPAIAVARRAADLARRLGLGQTLGVALAFEATGHARAGREADMAQCMAAARAELPAGADAEVLEIGARVYLSYVRDDTAGALRLLDGSAEARYSAPFSGPWALLSAVQERNLGPLEEIHVRGEPVEFSGRAYLRYAEAVAHGRAGRVEDADAALAAGDLLLARFGWFRHYGHRLVAQAAVTDAWGDPVGLLREAQEFFTASGGLPIASTCRSLLRRAGVPVRRQGRGGVAVPSGLRALGVTGREADVLALVGEGLTNAEIAERLFLSPRTVETHVGRLLAKTGAANRRELARLSP